MTQRALRIRSVVRYAVASGAVVLLVAVCAWAGGLERSAW